MRFLRFIARGFWAILLSLFFFITWLVGTLLLTLTFRGSAARQRFSGRVLALLFRQLGATYVKIGQIMSTRPDLFPQPFLQALETLQDDVGAFAYRHVVRTFEEDLGQHPEKIFKEFTQAPVASASVAQVHRALTHEGQEIAVKVRRPDIEGIVAFDLFFIRNFARVLSWLPFLWIFNLYESAEEFAAAIALQLDLRLEAQNNLRFQDNFRELDSITFPILVPEFSTKRILTMHYIDGRRILDYDQYGANPSDLAKLGLQAVLKMVFVDGFVHADLHPGNIWVTPDHKLALLDLGLTATLEPEDRMVFTQFFAAWAAKQGKTMARLMAHFSPSAAVRDYPSYEADVCAFVTRYGSAKIGDTGVANVFLDMMGILRRHRIRSNPTFTMVNLSLGITEGIGRQLDGDIDLMEVATQFFASGQGRPQSAVQTTTAAL